jgi:hypothetical protein
MMGIVGHSEPTQLTHCWLRLAVVSEGSSETTIFYDPATGNYGFSTGLPGHHPHHMVDTFESVQDVFGWCDTHRERIWEEVSDADETTLLISRDFKEGTVGWRMAHLTLAELGAVIAH